MTGISSAIAIAGFTANLIKRESGTILVSREGRISQDSIRLEPPISMEEADKLAARIEEGVEYAELGIVPTDVGLKPDNQARWFMRR